MSWLYSHQWAAGFFDGEGNIYLRKDHRHSGPLVVEVSVAQKMIEPLAVLKAQWGGSLTATKTPAGCFRWRTSAANAERFLRAIQPFSLVKAQAIQGALDERAKVRPHTYRGTR